MGELGALINRITEEVLHRMGRAQPQNEDVSGTLALVSAYVPAPQTALFTLRAAYGQDIEFLTFGTAFTPFGENSRDAGDLGRDAVLEAAARAANIVLVTPKLGVLKNIAAGDDAGFVEHVVIRALLWGRGVAALLDFPPPRFKRNTFFEAVSDALDALAEMGVTLLDYNCAAKPDAERLSLVTERDVLDAYAAGAQAVLGAPGALVTPSARDKAAELGIRIDY